MVKKKMPLPDDLLEKWKYKEHTMVKHEILSKYLDGWVRILGKSHNLNIFDCFAGRGRYSEGEEGSPLVIIKTIAGIREKMERPKEASCIFIEKNGNNFQNLQIEMDKEIKNASQRYDGWLNIELYNDEFANVASRIIDEYSKRLAPSFFFIDPSGFSGVSFEVIKDILSIKKTEVFITFMVRDVNRFFESSTHRISIEELCGMDNVQAILQNQYPNLPREQALLKLYRNQLHKSASVKYTLPFKVNADKKVQTIYYLIHVTNSPKGCELMKEIMYKTGTAGRFGYLGPAEGQMNLTQYDGLSKLKEFLLVRFSGRTVSYQNVRYETLMDTDFVRKHYHDAILELEEEDKIQIAGKGPRGGLPENALITFP
jgi:three-Cys-motif partner protein